MAPAARVEGAGTPPAYVQVGSELEFSRLVCALERAPRVSFMHDHGGRKVLSVQMDLLRERPVIYFAPLEARGHYLRYGFRGGREEAEAVDSTADNSMLYSPIIRIKSLPENLLPGDGGDAGGEDGGGEYDMYHPLLLEDLASLAKLSYGFEEAPFPLFSFPAGGRWLVGVFMNFNEDGPSYFCHVSLGEEPVMPFLKYSTHNGVEPSFVGSPDEHGYSYIKVIRLKDPHPLVDYAQLQD